MINGILIIWGIIFLIAGVGVFLKSFKFFVSIKLKIWWGALLGLNIFFILGYSFLFYLIVSSQFGGDLFSVESLFVIILFFGSIFVFLNTYSNYSALFELEDKKRELEKFIDNLSKEKNLVEEKIKTRTADLEKFNKYLTGRELKMIALKKEIVKMKKLL